MIVKLAGYAGTRVIGRSSNLVVETRSANMALAGLLLLGLVGCSEAQVEELVFRKTLEYQLKDRCGESDESCIEAVEAQIAECMRQSD